MPGRGGDGAVGEREGAGDRLRLRGMAEADAPGAAVGMAAEGTHLADVQQDVAHAGILQQGRDAIGNIALGDAVQRDGHARTREADLGRLDLDGAVVHQSLRPSEVGCGGPLRTGARTREVRGMEAPERLHGDVEGALRPLRIGAGLGQQRDEFERRRREATVPIEAGERALGPVEAEHVLQPVDLGDAAVDEAAGAGGVRIVQDDLGGGAQRDAGPAVQIHRLRAGARRHEREARRGRGDSDEAPPCGRGSH